MMFRFQFDPADPKVLRQPEMCPEMLRLRNEKTNWSEKRDVRHGSEWIHDFGPGVEWCAKGQGQRQGKGKGESDWKGGMSKHWGILAKKSECFFTFFKQSSQRAQKFERWIQIQTFKNLSEFIELVVRWSYDILWLFEFLPHWVWSMNSCWSVSGCSSTQVETTALTSDHVEHKRHGQICVENCVFNLWILDLKFRKQVMRSHFRTLVETFQSIGTKFLFVSRFCGCFFISFSCPLIFSAHLSRFGIFLDKYLSACVLRNCEKVEDLLQELHTSVANPLCQHFRIRLIGTDKRGSV